MFSGEGFSEFAFSEHDADALDALTFTDFLELVTSPRCWLLEIDALSTEPNTGVPGTFAGEAFGDMSFGEDDDDVVSGVVTLVFSTHGYTSHADDTPASTWYAGRIQTGITVDRRISAKTGVGGIATVFSELSLVNSDGELDTLASDYAIDGRPARVLLGDPDAARSTFGLVFSGTAGSPATGTGTMRLRLSDGSSVLDKPLNQNVYAGTGGLEGGADLTGKYKPKAYGSCSNVPAVLVDAANLIYQVNDGAIDGVPAVYDRQTILTEVPGAPGAGQYQVTASTGTFKLGSTPAGTVTCDVEGDAVGGYVETTADLIRRILVTQSGLYDSQIDSTSFDVLNDDSPATVGTWCGTEGRTTRDVIEELLGDSAFGGFNRYGTFSVGQIKAADLVADRFYTEQEIGDIDRLPLPAALDPIVWRVIVGYQKNYTVQNDVAGSVTSARRTFASQEYRAAVAADATIKSRRLLAKEMDVRALYADEDDADDEAVRLFGVWGGDRKIIQAALPISALTLDIGSFVGLMHRRFGLSEGATGVVLSHALKDTSITVTALV